MADDLREAQLANYGDWLVENGLPESRRAAAVQRAGSLDLADDGWRRCPTCGDPERPLDMVGGVCLSCADAITFAHNARRGSITVPAADDRSAEDRVRELLAAGQAFVAARGIARTEAEHALRRAVMATWGWEPDARATVPAADEDRLPDGAANTPYNRGYNDGEEAARRAALFSPSTGDERGAAILTEIDEAIERAVTNPASNGWCVDALNVVRDRVADYLAAPSHPSTGDDRLREAAQDFIDRLATYRRESMDRDVWTDADETLWTGTAELRAATPAPKPENLQQKVDREFG